MKTLEMEYGGKGVEWDLKKENINTNLRVAIPGIIVSFDSSERTATVRPAIREVLHDMTGKRVNVALPELLDVPVLMPHSGGFNISMPVEAGDECLVVFADMCIDAWWQSGGVQNQVEQRRHDLSDGFAILGPFSQTKRTGIQSGNLVIEHPASGTSITVKATGGVDITVPDGKPLKVNGDMTVSGTINGKVI